MLATVLLTGLGVAAGAMLAVQAGINASLARLVGSPVNAAIVSFVVGTLALALLQGISGRGFPALGTLRTLPLWLLAGGLLGAAYMTTAIWLAPRLGAAGLAATAITGWLAAAVALDHLGLVGFAQRSATPLRLLGVGLLLAGTLLVVRR